MHLLELSSIGFHAFAANAPSAGEKIAIHVPALGLLDARVTWAEAREFRRKSAVQKNLRLLFYRSSSAARAGRTAAVLRASDLNRLHHESQILRNGRRPRRASEAVRA